MSRTYYEFRKAQDNYRIEHALKISAFPYPPKESIVYTRQSTEKFWEDRRTTTASQISPTTLSFTSQDTFNFIRSAAHHEEQKELDFLAKFFPSSEIRPGQSLTEQFNILFQGRERYERLLQRIKNAQMRTLWGWKGMAPNMDSLYASYLNTRLTQMVEQFRKNFKATTDLPSLEISFNNLINEAIIEATNDVAAVIEEDGVYGSGKDWTEIAQILNTDQYLKEQFISNIRNAIGADKLNSILPTLLQQKKKKIGKKKTTTILRENLKLNERTASIGGNVIENTMAALAQALGQIRGSNDSISYEISGSAIHGQMALTDAAMVFSASASIDTSQAIKILNEQLSGSTGSLKNAYDAIDRYYQEYNKNLDELYTVFVNSKNYQLGGSHGTYSQPQRGQLSELDEFLKRAKVHVSNVDAFLLAAYNTAKGNKSNAIYSSQSEQIYNGAIEALKAAAVNFMFDDWQTLGNGSSNSIHMFMLDGKYVPSSVIFNAMADAGQNAVSSNAKIYIPDINDPGPQGYEKGKNDLEAKQNILSYWNEEYDRISRNAYWTANFVINIKKAIGL